MGPFGDPPMGGFCRLWPGRSELIMPDVERNASGTAMMPPTWRFDLIGQEMLASQVVAVMDAHWARPGAEQKRDILCRAERQILRTGAI